MFTYSSERLAIHIMPLNIDKIYHPPVRIFKTNIPGPPPVCGDSMHDNTAFSVWMCIRIDGWKYVIIYLGFALTAKWFRLYS